MYIQVSSWIIFIILYAAQFQQFNWLIAGEYQLVSGPFGGEYQLHHFCFVYIWNGGKIQVADWLRYTWLINIHVM